MWIWKKFLLFSLIATGNLFAGLESDIDRATSMMAEFPIPGYVLDRAKGVVTMSVLKGGFIFSGRVGSGLVAARLDKGWSAPSALGIGGAGWGFQVGAKLTDFVLVLNTQAALDAFASGASITLGGSLSIAAGPIGGTAEGSVTLPPAAIFYYGISRGVFGGASIEGTIITSRGGANREFYGESVTTHQLLSGQIPPPKRADRLYHQLERK